MPASVLPNQEETSTRREIVNILRMVGPLTVGELGERLGITHVAVRRHLTSLERDGLVSSVQERLPMGRPTRVYSLTDAADELFPKKYGNFTLEMLEFLTDTNEQVIDQFFQVRGQRMIERFGPVVQEGATLKERISLLAENQQANGYLADWETPDDETFTLKEFNCPVHQVARKYPQSCQHELHFFRTVLGTENVQRVECIAEGGTCCRYVIGKTTDQ